MLANKIKSNYLFMTMKLLMTISSSLLFVSWLMLITNNFYNKNDSNFINSITSLPIQISIWPCILIILFIFIMPIWITNNKSILFIFLIIAHTIIVGNFYFLFLLNINSYWIYWLTTDIINFLVIIFTLFTLINK